MNITSRFYRIFLSGTLCILFLASCRPSATKADEAFDLVKKERMLSNDSSFASDKIIQESMKTVIVKKDDTPDEWTLFKMETEKKLRLNDKIIKELEYYQNASGSLRRKVASLKKDNNDLKIRLISYQEEVKAKWEMFKASTSHSAKAIEIELSTLKKASKVP
ncbi:MAG: hypothetical protein WC699_05545 [Bacteroidales bacterium]|jgi:hypothetical protein